MVLVSVQNWRQHCYSGENTRINIDRPQIHSQTLRTHAYYTALVATITGFANQRVFGNFWLSCYRFPRY